MAITNSHVASKSPFSPLSVPVPAAFEGKNPYSPMTIPADFNTLEEPSIVFDLEFAEGSDPLEPESEQSPASRTFGAGRGGVIPSFASTVSDLDYPEYTSSAGHGMVSRGPLATASWNSNATDFDNVTSLGAQAEQSGAYRDAVLGAQVGVQMYAPNAPLPTLLPSPYFTNAFQLAPGNRAPSMFGGHGCTNQTGIKGADALQSQAADFERAAEQLMLAAMQAKAVASQMNAQVPQAPHLSHSVSQVDTQKPRWSLLGTLKKNRSMRQSENSTRTSVMLRNLPNDYTRDMLLQLLDCHGFSGQYTFVYLPVDFQRGAGLGYAFVNMASTAAAESVFASMQGFCSWQFASAKVLEVSWSEPLQGLDAHIDRYRNSPVMHPDVPEAFRPLLFQNGVVVPFPQPTKKLQKPRMKASANEA